MKTPRTSWRTTRRAVGLALAALLLGSGLAGAALPARADTQPPVAGTPETVAADALSTWQLTGVVWSQVVVGTTVYATGNFTKARPSGHWSGGPQEINVSHLFAYDIQTGQRVAIVQPHAERPGARHHGLAGR